MRGIFHLILVSLIVCNLLVSSARADFSLVGEAPDLHPEVATLFEQMWRAFSAKNYFQVLALIQQTQDKAREVGDKTGEAFTLFARSEIASRFKQTEQAKQFDAEARELMRAGGDRAAEARILNSVGAAYRAIGQPQKALELFQQSLKIRQDIGDKSGQAESLLLLGQLYAVTLGQSQAAIGLINQALALSREAGHKGHEATALYRLAQIDSNSGQAVEGMTDEMAAQHFHARAFELCSQALRLWQQTNDRQGQVVALLALGDSVDKDRLKSISYYEQALELVRALRAEQDGAGAKVNIFARYQLQRNEATLTQRIGENYVMLKQNERGLSYLQQALGLAREMSDAWREATLLNTLAVINHYQLNKFDAAYEYYKQSQDAFVLTGDTVSLAGVSANLALLEESTNRLDEAESSWRKAVSAIEAARSLVSTQSADKTANARHDVSYYDQFVKLLLRRGKIEEAFALAERTKGRVLLDLMQNGKVEITTSLTDEERTNEKQLRDRLAQLNVQLVAESTRAFADANRLKEVRSQMADAEADWRTYSAALYATHPDLAAKRNAHTTDLQGVSRWLPADTVLLNYFVLQGINSELMVFAVTVRDGKAVVNHYALGEANDELHELLEDFRTACADPKKNFKSKARELYQKLIQPAKKDLQGKSRVLICPDESLWGVPFGAMMNGEEFFLQQQEIVYSYNATVAEAALKLKASREQIAQPLTLLLLANPDYGGPARLGNSAAHDGQRPITADGRAIEVGAKSMERGVVRGDGAINPLPGTQAEADAIKKILANAAMLTGLNAQEAAIKKDGGKYQILHFATHGLFNDVAPLQSSIVLAQPPAGSTEDGFLTAREIFEQDWKTTDLVVLSACETGRGKDQKGEGILGLTWALFVAGAPSQIVSQWKVSDTASAELMKRFYTHLRKDEGKAASLRAAEMELLAQPEYSHPYYWAPFTLLGDWR